MRQRHSCLGRVGKRATQLSFGVNFNMSDIDNYTPWEPSIKMYVLAVLVGTVVAIVFAGVVFATSSIVVAASMGGILALFGALMGENIGEAIVLSVILGLLCGLMLFVPPDPVAKWVGTWALPAVLGFCSSGIVIGISRELEI